jgi:hypothetical protein
MSSGKIAARGCTRTRAIENAAEDIEFLNRYLEGKTTTSISGVVRLQSDEPEGNRDVARPVEGSVTLAGLDKQYTRMTDSGGGYSLTGIAPGSYQIRYELPGYKAEWAPDSVMVSPKGCAVADAFLRVARRIHGTVRKEDGQPASGVSVELSPQHPEPESWRNPVLVAESDDRGRFEIDGIPPGTFLLGINISRAPTKRQPYPPTFHPNTRDRREAFPIPVPIGAFEQSFDLTVPASLPLVTFRGRIVDAGGAAATRRPQVRIKEPGLSGQIEDSPIEVDAEGRFQIEICEGVRYSAYAFAGFPGDVYSAPVEFVPGRERPELTLVLNKSAQQFLELSRQLQEDLK